MVAMETTTIWKFLFQFLVNILKLFKGAKSDYDHIKEENVKKQLKFSIFFVSDHLNKIKINILTKMSAVIF